MTDARAIDLGPVLRMPPLVEAFLRGESRDLLDPVRYLAPDERPGDGCGMAGPDRRTLASALGKANEAYGHPAAARLAGALADPKTRVVITGQQPGLFGGPLYTLAKAVAVALWAEHLRSAGEPAVPLFWMATEDHDFRESSQASFPTPSGVRRFDLGEDREPLVPVGERRLGAGVTQILTELRLAFPGDRYGEWLGRLGEWYRPEATFGEAFSWLMVAMLGDRCPLLVDARLGALKAAQRPWLRQIVERREELGAAFADRDERITAAGYSLQVKPQPGTSPLFLQQDRQRRRIEWRGANRFGLRGEPGFEEEVGWLERVIDEEPARISPGVRARSAIQDAVLGTCLQVLGPGELAYLPQAAPLFELLDVPAPWATLRPQILVMDERQQAKMAGVGVGIEQLLDADSDLDALLARAEDTRFLDESETALETLLGQMRDPAIDLDPQLEKPLQKTADQMRRALQAFSGRVTAAAARRDEVARKRLRSLREYCLPEGKPQERIVASAHFPGKYGEAFVPAVFEQMRLDTTNLQIVAP